MIRGRLVLALFLAAAPAGAFGCWQQEQPPVLLHAVSLNAQVVNHDKRKNGAKFELHRAITFDREEAKRTAAYQRDIFRIVATDSLGMFSFGEVPQGRYWIVPTGARLLSDSIAVEIMSPRASDTFETLKISYYADGCKDVLIEKATHK